MSRVTGTSFAKLFAAAAASTLLLGVGACGGDDNELNCEEDFIHGCDGATSFTLEREVGELRVERIQADANGDGVVDENEGFMATHAYFFNNQDPLTRTFGIPVGDTGCVDYRDRQQFSPGFSEEAQLIANSRTYLDAGASVTLTSGNGNTLELPKQLGTADRSSGLTHAILYQQDDNDLTPFENNTSWSFAFPGSDELPALDAFSAESAVTFTVLDELQAFTPPSFALTFIDEAEYFANGVTIPDGADFEFSWTYDEAFVEPDVVMIGFVGFLGPDGIDFLCLRPDADDAGDSIVVPPEILADVTDTGTLIVGTLTHVAAEARAVDNGRYDVLGVDCKLSSFAVERQ